MTELSAAAAVQLRGPASEPGPGWLPPPPVRASGGSGPVPPRTTVLDGGRLRQVRRAHGLSQDELASRAGISLATVARLERQACSPCRTRTLGRLAAALGEHPSVIAPQAPGTDQPGTTVRGDGG